MNDSPRKLAAGVRYVLFDAVGTLLLPSPPAPQAYAAIGARFGIAMAPEAIRGRLREALRLHAQDWEQPTSEAHERDRWRRIVADVLPTPAGRADELFDSLWRHFAEPRHWSACPDAAPAWRWLTAAGVELGVASNFDGRFEAICESIDWLAACPRRFYSSQIGFAKPNGRFFRRIEELLGARPQELLLVGDDLDNDYHAALAAGWRAVWLDRGATALWETLPPRSVAARIGDLRELAELFGSEKSPG